MVRGKISLQVNRRLFNPTAKHYRDKYEMLGNIVMFNWTDEYGRKRMRIISQMTEQQFDIGRDELAFIRVMKIIYGYGDYCIKMWGKGKSRGFRVFWDGFIRDDDKYFRRRRAGINTMDAGVLQRESFAKNPQDFVGKYLKCKPAGKWYHI